ncbi:hypothetical protein K469DRAFT_717340 [Zopfia rhizophila CBS 207.26]|uniref:Coenzyme Q-binding protein COQ10 START domain-containing protein n=1 Tax=Zopfia rhizophila CBS 207.26 TaxID=1314779 RepID=A0A6A6EP49_9PEZI|nr:hypothetical protein K469DRAFT_717340 [Zopfia rhizophila CBS 207.26]
MTSLAFQVFLASLFFVLPQVSSRSTNLPNVPPGVFTVSARIEIKTTTSAAWNALVDFPSYPNWNPFVRSAIVITPDGAHLPEQRPVENRRAVFRVQIPPLPLPVTASTPENPLHTQIAFENITHIQPDLGRLAWKYISLPQALDSERWQAISSIGNGRVLYESREVFSGALAPTLRDTLGEGLQEAFEAQAKGLKLLLEGTL